MSTNQKTKDGAVQGAVSRERSLPDFRSALSGEKSCKSTAAEEEGW